MSDAADDLLLAQLGTEPRAARSIAGAIGWDLEAVYEALLRLETSGHADVQSLPGSDGKRFGWFARIPGGLTGRILAACGVAHGMSQREIREATGGSTSSVASLLCQLLATGRLHKAGPKMLQRYFARGADAAAWATVADDEIALERQRREDAKQARRREDRAAERVQQPPKPVNVAKPKAVASPKPAPPAPKSLSTKRKDWSSLRPAEKPAPVTIAKPRIEQKVIVPPHVKVTVCPSGRDDRFTFTPPPGWRGAITTDWLDRRLREQGR